MKKFSLLIALPAGLLLASACGGEGGVDEEPTTPVTPTTPTAPSAQANANANPATPSEYRRLEMPALHRGSDTVLVHKTADGMVNYITEWDFQKRAQRWSCYILTQDLLQQNTQRYTSDDNQYPQDPLIDTSLQWSEDPYYSNGQRFDHGHICPSADRLNSSEANYQTFFLTNMQPQFNAFNAGLWARMEAKVRAMAKTCDTLYVCKGGTIDGGTFGGYNKVYHTLANGLLVPRYFFMALLRVNGGNYSAVALWTDQITNSKDSGSSLSRYAISIDELEERTGIDFFCNLPDATEDTVEKTFYSTVSWGLN